jgi:integrase
MALVRQVSNFVPNLSRDPHTIRGVSSLSSAPRLATGHVFRREGSRGPVWYAKYRLPDGRQQQKRIGPAWTQRGRPGAGYFTKRGAESYLRDLLDRASRGELGGMVHTGTTFDEAADRYLGWLREDRARKPSTLRDYGSILDYHLRPTFGHLPVEDVTPDLVVRWYRSLGRESGMSNRTKIKITTVLHGVMERARRDHRLPINPVRDLGRPTASARVTIDVFSPEEVMALVRAAADEQDAAIYLTAAFTGLRRGELVALRWRDVDFAGSHVRVTASYGEGGLSTPKSGKVRSVPMAPAVAEALARLAQREVHTGSDDLVFPGIAGGHLDASALYRRYKRALRSAGLRNLRFHDLRHTFGTRMIGRASILQVKEWMGHADVDTTMKYLHYAPKSTDAALVAAAFAPETAVSPTAFADS